MKLTLLLLLIPCFLWAEDPPEAEYPYPSTVKETSTVEQPVKIDSSGTYYYDTNPKKKLKKIQGVEAPIDGDEDGTYYYPINKKQKTNNIDGVEKPISGDNDGTYYYMEKRKQKPVPNGVPQPKKIEKDGTYVYNDDEDRPTTSAFYFRGGTFGAPKIKGATQNYEQVYGTDSNWVIAFEYEWKMFDFLGELLVKFGSGISIDDGTGQYATPGNNNPAILPKEEFQFILFPNTLSLSYKFQFWNSQYFTPYVDGGLGYYTFWERRSDNKKNNLGGAPVLSASAGLLISLTKWTSGTSLLSDYGIHQMWLDLQYRQVVGLDDRKDFSSNMITGGFGFGF